MNVYYNGTGLVVPVYNGTDTIERTLDHLDYMTNYIPEVLLVDDASKDSTPTKIREYISSTGTNVKGLYRETNGRKVGAIADGVRALNSDINNVVLIDADSRISNPENLGEVLDYMELHPTIAGGGFRIEPTEKKGLANRVQRNLYTIDRSIHKFTSKRNQLRCAPGAGCVYKRAPLETALSQHSGRHAGDDFEITLLVEKQGYGMKYFPEIEVDTDVPSTFLEHLKQQARWKQGGLETMAKERKFVSGNIKKGTRLGAVSAVEIAGWASLPISFGYMAYNFKGLDLETALSGLGATYAATTALISPLLLYNRKEIRTKNLLNLPLLPMYLSVITPLSAIKSVADVSKPEIKKLLGATMQKHTGKISGAERTF